MNVNHKLELLDQLDDAAFALMMDEYAEAEGERLRAEFEADMRAGLTPPMPEGLDEKCRKQIKAEYGRARWAEYGARARKMAVKAAAVLLIGIGIAAATVMSVEAIREPIWKNIIEHFQGHSQIDFQSSSSNTTPTKPADPFYLYQPSGYQNTQVDDDRGRIRCRYENEQGDFLTLSMTYSEDSQLLGPLDENHRYIDLEGYNAFYVTEDERKLFWYDENIQTAFTVNADNLSEKDFMLYCKGVVEHCKNATLIDNNDGLNPLPNVLPATYEELYSDQSYGLLMSRYQSKDGTILSFRMDSMIGTLNYNTEGAVSEETTILDYDAIYVHGTDRMLIWFDTEREIIFNCATFGDVPMGEEDFFSLCEYLAEYYKDVTLPAVSTVILP